MKAKGATIVEGDGDMPMNFTTTDDTAKYVAVAVSDPDLANKALEVAGDTLTAKQLKATYEEATGTKLTEKLLGSVTEFKAWIAAKKAAATKLEEYVYHQYIYAMVSGKGKLVDAASLLRQTLREQNENRVENDYLR
jgi:hypothetical protein